MACLSAYNNRFIPTAVGNAVPAQPAIIDRPVHPHGCGERSAGNLLLVAQGGSSPRLWGTPRVASFTPSNPRFIPTAVGNAVSLVGIELLSMVHPHGCGERTMNKCLSEPCHGSSPRLWGTPFGNHRIRARYRFIPTAVGNARFRWRRQSACTVHPHGCGERAKYPWDLILTCGSSPRLWGTRHNYVAIRPTNRFIPTAVGNAGAHDMTSNVITVHPHGCGERSNPPQPKHVRAGSSPRLWGTQMQRHG